MRVWGWNQIFQDGTYVLVLRVIQGISLPIFSSICWSVWPKDQAFFLFCLILFQSSFVTNRNSLPFYRKQTQLNFAKFPFLNCPTTQSELTLLQMDLNTRQSFGRFIWVPLEPQFYISLRHPFCQLASWLHRKWYRKGLYFKISSSTRKMTLKIRLDVYVQFFVT